MFYIDWAILMLDQNTAHPNIPHTFGYSAKKTFKTIRKNYHHLPSHKHKHKHHILPITNGHPTMISMYHDRSSRLSDHLIVPHNVHHTSVECFFLIPEVDCNNHKQMNTMIHQWSIPILISYMVIWAWNMYSLLLYLQLTNSKPKHDTLNMIPDHNDKWQLNT